MLPNLLDTRRGAMAAFFSFYVIEGIPYGLVGVVLATQLRREGVGPADIGAFVGAFFLPLALKWAYAPFVDVFRSKRFGHRRGWILLSQLLMAATMLALVAVPLPEGMAIFTAILLVHSVFVAIHDVAVDSLAVTSLAEENRGVCNGLMLAGAMLGQAAGAAGVLFLLSRGVALPAIFVGFAIAILMVTVVIVLPMKEVVTLMPARHAGSTRWHALRRDLGTFAAQSLRAFMGNSGSFQGVFFALLPAGAIALGSALSSNLAVEFGMKDDGIASLSFWTSIVAAAAMVAGGWISDRFGRRLTLSIYISCMSLPTLYLMWVMQAHGYVMPRAPGGQPLADLLLALWIASIAYMVFGGLMVGARGALMMDVTDPRVAATQFTAYMAIINLSMAFGARWQGLAAEAWGYPITLALDACIGLLCLAFLPAMKRRSESTDEEAGNRARWASMALGAACLSWLPYGAFHDLLGKAQPIVNTLFTLVFVASALFLLAAREVVGEAASLWRRASFWTALLLLAMHARHWVGAMDSSGIPGAVAQVLLVAVPLAGGLMLLILGSRKWLTALEPGRHSIATTPARP